MSTQRQGLPDDSPRGLPNQSTAGDDRQTAGNQHDDSNVGNARGKISAQGDEDDANTAERKLKENAVKRIVTKGAYNQRTKSRYGTVDGISLHKG